MKRYRKKPVVIEAYQFRGDVGDPEVVKLDLGCAHDRERGCDYLIIRTLEGEMRAYPGDWIIRGVAGELYPCKPDIFHATYEPAE
jgi:hypothetical protein